MVEHKKNSAVEEACAFFEKLFGPAPEVQGDFRCSDVEHVGASNAFEGLHVLDMLQAVRKRLLKAGKTVYHLCN
ncbi:MAG: hypothetical protein P4L53_23190 [Candidatus Obscuribacterales bacterium]|nr:hypothetical protein [Candidatus Obscuribacterales bacterium]